MLISIILKDLPIKSSEQVKISDITTASVVELLESHGINAWIKPPNDVWVDTKKICGILIEHSLRGNHISWSIIGIGLNVNQTLFPDNLPNPTSMKIEKEGADIEDLTSEFMDIFTRRASEL
jgi:BirA family biotin operon repressor/biotin-[acetyl-CoA-carboxylase] ligase